MKLNLLFETDAELRGLERLANAGDQDAMRRLHDVRYRTGQIDDSIPPELAATPSKILKIHKQRFRGFRWPEFEDLILNYKRTQSFEKNRTGYPTYPTQLAARYASQLNEPWPEFLPLAKHMLDYIERNNWNLYINKVSPVVIMIAKYLIKHNLSPSWIGDFYGNLQGRLELALTPTRIDPETGAIEHSTNPEWELAKDYYPGLDDSSAWVGRERHGESFEDLNRVLPGLKRLANIH